MSERVTAGDLLFALRYLTVVPAPRGRGALGPATLFFPPVGLLIGLVALAGDLLLERGWPMAPPPARAGVAVALLALAGGLRPLRGLAHSGDAIGRDRARALDVMERAAVGPAGAALVLAALAGKLLALWDPGPLRPWALALAPMLGRWAMVVVAFSARQARPGTPGPRFEAGITFREFGWASVIAGVATLATLEALGLLAILSVAAAALGLRLVCHRWLGGLSPAAFWASAEAAEVVALLVLRAPDFR
jgi:adenosylcobinamide-GDP ribazoletransferase